MNKDDHVLIGEMIQRLVWQEGTLDDRLKSVEDRARLRASGHVYSGNRKLDKKIVKLAKKVRKALR